MSKRRGGGGAPAADMVLASSGRGKGSGVEIEELRASLFHVRRGKVTRRVNYWDRDRALADLGLEE